MAKQSLKNIFRLIEAATDVLPIEDQFVSDLKAAIEKQDSKEARKPSQSYKPSSMKCIRNMYFQVTGAEQDDQRANYCLIGIVQSGSDRHERLQEAISKMKDFGMDCEYIDAADFAKQRNLDYLQVVAKQGYETKFYHKDLNISFLCDGIILYKGKYYILEIKTETIHKWQTRKGVDPEHYAQASTYSICLGIDEVMFVYENRDNCDKKAYLFKVEDEMKFEIVSKIEECDKFVKILTPPPIPEDITKKTCQYCNYRALCRKVGSD